ncbi:MAG: SUMF1/EgtB/PvdO family nonheme iron enzyme [Nitrospinae bacterium]|nr:SUMF1/EgtB/PvdO family nonheme iron enzyme [Nitrospinota bacterium]
METGSLKLETKPEYAEIFIDAESKGRTPLLIERLSAGEHRITLKKENYHKHNELIEIKPGETTEIKRILDVQKGAIKITSVPSGAKVFLNEPFTPQGRGLGPAPAGIKQGVRGDLITPLEITDVRIGEYQIRLELPDYKPFEQKIEVRYDEFVTVNAQMSPFPAKLLVTSTPEGASVYIDDKEIGKTDYHGEITPGEHNLAVELTGYEREERKINIEPNGSDSVDFRLKKAAAPAIVTGKSYIEPVTGMEFVFVKGGCYQMGDIFGGDAGSDERPMHEVCIDDFYMGKYEVTQRQWTGIMGNNPSYFKNCDDCPVEQVSWNDVQEYINKLNQKTGKNYRLPTEAEWEYAARSGGKKEKYSGGNNIDSVGWYNGNSGSKTHPVGQKEANGLGLYDMTGNVWEWCQDCYGENYYKNSPKNNPKGASSGQYRVLRGGSWFSLAWFTRATNRAGNFPDGRDYGLGFRVVVSSVRQ